MNELLNNWKFDVYHIGAVVFLLSVAAMVVWIIKDSIKKNKK